MTEFPIFETKKVPDILAVIPARYASSRFPGKPLAVLGTKPMIRWVYESSSGVFEHLVVATDDSRIRDAVESFGGRVVMTSAEHRSGTDRCMEALQICRENEGIDFSHVVNIQGDEPMIMPEQLQDLVSCLEMPDTGIATLIRVLGEEEDPYSPHIVKVVVNRDSTALYFSRSVIPFYRDPSGEVPGKRLVYYAHIGLYGFRAEVLEQVTRLPVSLLESAESLEQLRWLENGYPIKTRVTVHHSPGVDTPEDLEKITRLLL
jgi:3-deoxy-manno-octulosonate cytidylyltransferase (CMP-KDO synthetase)